jgi:ZIP family zinc transporter
MTAVQNTALGLLIPFLGTALGAACVFFLKKEMGEGLQRALTGFAAGVMVAASVWSLLIPALEQASAWGTFAFVPAVAGFWAGRKTTMLVLAVTLHNIPEGMAVGVVFAAFLKGSATVTAAAAFALSQSESRSRTFRKARSFPCRCIRRA